MVKKEKPNRVMPAFASLPVLLQADEKEDLQGKNKRDWNILSLNRTGAEPRFRFGVISMYYPA